MDTSKIADPVLRAGDSGCQGERQGGGGKCEASFLHVSVLSEFDQRLEHFFEEVIPVLRKKMR